MAERHCAEHVRTVFDVGNLQGNDEFTLDAVGVNVVRDGFVANDATFPAWRITVFHDPVELVVDGAVAALEKNSVCCLPPRVAIRYGRSVGTWSHSWVRFSGRLAAEMTGFELKGIEFPLVVSEPDRLLRHILAIYDEMFDDAPDLFIVRFQVNILLRELRRLAMRERTFVPPNLLAARKFLERHYLEKIGLRELARDSAMSQAHFCVSFRKYFGMTPGEYLIKLRIGHAVNLLDHLNLNISEIAAQSGFSDVYYFSRRFKAVWGCSPTSFRKNQARCGRSAFPT